jgi:hypothetical protein
MTRVAQKIQMHQNNNYSDFDQYNRQNIYSYFEWYFLYIYVLIIMLSSLYDMNYDERLTQIYYNNIFYCFYQNL